METELQDKGKTNLAKILGIIGGIVGVIAGFAAAIVGGAGVLLAADMGVVIWLGAIGVVLGAIGVFGATVAESNPRMSMALMLVAGLGGFVAVSLFWLLPGLLLIVAAIVEWTAFSKRRRVRL